MVGGPGTMAVVEEELVFYGEGVGHSTAALDAWLARHPGAEERAALVLWTRCCFPDEVREAGRAYRRLRRRRRGACQRVALRRLSLRKVFVGRPVLVDLADGHRESDVAL